MARYGYVQPGADPEAGASLQPEEKLPSAAGPTLENDEARPMDIDASADPAGMQLHLGCAWLQRLWGVLAWQLACCEFSQAQLVPVVIQVQLCSIEAALTCVVSMPHQLLSLHPA